MKRASLTVLCLALGVTTVQAATHTASLSSTSKTVNMELQPGDSLSIQYDLYRQPILRSSVWYYYALYCTAAYVTEISYPLDGRKVTVRSPLLASFAGDTEHVGEDMDPQGELILKNESAHANWVRCDLHWKFGG